MNRCVLLLLVLVGVAARLRGIVAVKAVARKEVVEACLGRNEDDVENNARDDEDARATETTRL